MYCMVWWKTRGSEVRLEFTMVSELVLKVTAYLYKLDQITYVTIDLGKNTAYKIPAGALGSRRYIEIKLTGDTLAAYLLISLI